MRIYSSVVAIISVIIFVQSTHAMLPTILKKNPKIFVTGFSNGRLHPYVIKAFQDKSCITLNSSAMPTESSLPEMIHFLQSQEIDCVVNVAALFKGPHHDIWNLNYEYATKLAHAAYKADATFIQASTITALKEKIDYDNHPYSYSKQKTNQIIQQLPNTVICHLGPLLGDNTSVQSDISFLAGIRGILPYTMHVDGKPLIIQPTSYEAAATAFMRLAFLKQNQLQVPKELNVVGDPISMDTFLRAANPSALFEIHVKKPDDLLDLASVVQNGINVPEFIKLAQLAQETDGEILDNTDYKNLIHGYASMPTPLELAELVGQRASVKQWAAHILDVVKKGGPMVFVEAVKLLPKIRLQLSPISESKC